MYGHRDDDIPNIDVMEYFICFIVLEITVFMNNHGPRTHPLSLERMCSSTDALRLQIENTVISKP